MTPAIGRNEWQIPVTEHHNEATMPQSADLISPFAEVTKQLNDAAKAKRRTALGLLAMWLVDQLDLHLSRWRGGNTNDTDTGEVNVIAISETLVYGRWQILCKNTKKKVTIDTLATQIGLALTTNADVVMVVTTSSFTSDAVNYANQVTDTSRYYVILLDGNDIQQITTDRARIVDILNAKARRVFARKEIGAVPLRLDSAAPVSSSEAQIGDEIANDAEALFGDES